MRYKYALTILNTKDVSRVQKLFMTNPYKLSIIKQDANGIITVLPNLTSIVSKFLTFYGNLNTISIPIGFDSSSAIVEKKL
jgi:hypothetical protein